MIRRILCLTILGLIMSANIVMADDSKKEAAAVSVAERWLGMIDEGKYAESWKEAAELFRNALTQEQWVNSLQAGRKPLGKLVSRKVLTKAYKTSLPGAPDGEYVVIQFQTSFENKKASIETVTPMIEKDGKWRVSGYYVR